MSKNESSLDNPVWTALNEFQSEFSLDFGGFKAYKTDITPFTGIENPDEISEKIIRDIEDYSDSVSEFFIVGGENCPKLNGIFSFKNDLVCAQMILDQSIKIDFKEEFVLLNNDYEKETFDFITRFFPGYFKSKTLLLGNYYGIFKDNNLVAVTGERMKTKSFTEISAVVTHPEYVGRGFAQQLNAFVSQKIFDENKIPFLHVGKTNEMAISLYEKLGFRHRKDIHFWHFEKITR